MTSIYLPVGNIEGIHESDCIRAELIEYFRNGGFGQANLGSVESTVPYILIGDILSLVNNNVIMMRKFVI